MVIANAQRQGILCAVNRKTASEQGVAERRWALLVRKGIS
jgi:hypothetical protein